MTGLIWCKGEVYLQEYYHNSVKNTLSDIRHFLLTYTLKSTNYKLHIKQNRYFYKTEK